MVNGVLFVCQIYVDDIIFGSTNPHFSEKFHYCRMLLTRHYDQRPFDETVCDAITANSGVKTVKKVQNVCDGGCIKHGSDFSCVCDAGHMVQFN